MASLNLNITTLASQAWDVVFKADNSGPEDKASRRTPDLVQHEELLSDERSYDENSISQVNGGRGAVSTPQSCSSSKIPTGEDISKLRGELDKNLEEEETLLSLQMQLLLQMEKLDSAILAAESKERLSKIARQQAQVIRLRRSRSAGGGAAADDEANDEVITIQIGS
jgi:hypothetical protein